MWRCGGVGPFCPARGRAHRRAHTCPKQQSIVVASGHRPMLLTCAAPGRRPARPCFPNSRWPPWPAGPCCRRPGSAGQFHLSRKVLHREDFRWIRLRGWWSLPGRYRTYRACLATRGGPDRPHARGPSGHGGFVTGGRMRSWLSSRSDASGQPACPGLSPATSPWSSGSQHRAHVPVSEAGSDIGVHLRPWYLRNGAGRSMLTKAIKAIPDCVASAPAEHALNEAVGEPLTRPAGPEELATGRKPAGFRGLQLTLPRIRLGVSS
jgi:hypothetical protein